MISGIYNQGPKGNNKAAKPTPKPKKKAAKFVPTHDRETGERIRTKPEPFRRNYTPAVISKR